MIRVKIEDLKPGMVLAKSVQNHQGVLLLEAGTRISKKNIRIFKSWGVPEFSVKGDLKESGTATDAPETAVEDAFETQLKAKFSDVVADPVMAEIYKAAIKLLKKKIPNNEYE